MPGEDVRDTEALQAPSDGEQRRELRPDPEAAREPYAPDVRDDHDRRRRDEERRELRHRERGQVVEAPHERVRMREDRQAEAAQRREVEVEAAEAIERVAHLVHRGQHRRVVVAEKRVVPVHPEPKRDDDGEEAASVEHAGHAAPH